MEPILFEFVYAWDGRNLVGCVGAAFLTIEKSKLVIDKLSPVFTEEETRSVVSCYYDVIKETAEPTAYDCLGYELDKFIPDGYILEPNGEGRRQFHDTLPSIFLGREDIYFVKPFEKNK